MHVDPVTGALAAPANGAAELEYTVRRCKVTMHYNAAERSYRATLTLPDGSIERNTAEPPDGVARLLEWARTMTIDFEPS